MIKPYFGIFTILILLFACKKQNKVTVEDISTKTDTIAINTQTNSQPETAPTPLYQFAAYMDSMGFGYDSSRMVKTYAYRDLSSPSTIINYHFFNYTLEQSSLILYLIENNPSDTTFENAIDLRLFKKAKSITSYFFTQREAAKNYYEKYFIDGFIEQWVFDDSTSAEKAAINLATHKCYVYFNTCAFICCIGNSMYVISSRSSGFMYALRPYVKWFFEHNATTVYADFHIY